VNAALREIAYLDREKVEQVVIASIRTVDFSLLESEGRIDFLFDVLGTEFD
jgi:hypothetical protein